MHILVLIRRLLYKEATRQGMGDLGKSRADKMTDMFDLVQQSSSHCFTAHPYTFQHLWYLSPYSSRIGVCYLSVPGWKKVLRVVTRDDYFLYKYIRRLPLLGSCKESASGYSVLILRTLLRILDKDCNLLAPTPESFFITPAHSDREGSNKYPAQRIHDL